MSVDEKVVEETAKSLRQYLDPMLLAPLSEMGLLVRDKIAFWRFQNQVQTLQRVKKIVEESGMEPGSVKSAITPDLVLPLIESSGETSDDKLQGMFARLLANAIKYSDMGLVHPSYAKIMNQMSPLDAIILQLLYTSVKEFERRHATDEKIEGLRDNVPIYRQPMAELDKACAVTKKTRDVVVVAFQNIRRLGLCDQGIDPLNFINRIEVLALTDYGYSFASQCMDS